MKNREAKRSRVTFIRKSPAGLRGNKDFSVYRPLKVAGPLPFFLFLPNGTSAAAVLFADGDESEWMKERDGGGKWS